MNDSMQFQVGLRKYVNTQNFWRVNEFLMLKSLCTYKHICMYVYFIYVYMHVFALDTYLLVCTDVNLYIYSLLHKNFSADE